METASILPVETAAHFETMIRDEDAILFYFSHEDCNVCKVLKPKIAALLDMDFPRLKMAYVDTRKLPEVAGQQSIFTVPTILVYFGGREYIRVSRNIGVSKLGDDIRRPYEMLFE